ncbi:hypothetical protein EPN87_01145 [archaeon]|nr:MAG: hypothetical protein EPN87_01145 [archaeon]
MIGWQDSNFRELYFEEDIKRRSLSESQSVYSCLKGEGANCLPYMVSSNCELLISGYGNTMTKLEDYYKQFLNLVLGKNSKDFSIGAIDEAFVNTIKHGSNQHKGKFLTIESYHPKEPSKALLRVSNPYAKEWDYKNKVKEELEKELDNVKLIRQGKSIPLHSGLLLLEKKKGILASYDDKGKDFVVILNF